MMTKSKIIWASLGSLFLAGVLVAVLTLLPKRQSIKENAAASTTLSIFPNTQNVYVGQNSSFSVQMDASTNSVSGMDLALNFDPASIQITSIAAGSGMSNMTNVPRNPAIDNANGKIYYSVFSTGSTVTGSNVDVLDVNGTVKSGATPGSKTIGFETSTAVIALDENGNVLLSKTPEQLSPLRLQHQ